MFPTVPCLRSLALVFGVVQPTPSQEDVHFRRDVEPILREHCFECHGAEAQKSDLRLDVRAGLFDGEDPDFLPVVPGNLELSVLYELVTLPEGDPELMPPDGPLPEEDRETLRRWIEQGAPWTEGDTPHPPSNPTLPNPAIAQRAEALLAASHERTVGFDRDIRPILSEHCFQCHGPDEATRAMDLRLDQADAAFAAMAGARHVIAPGDVMASELTHRILSDDDVDVMPPPETGKPLDDEQRALLLTWIAQGASWQEHWAFQPPTRSPPPATDRAWPRDDLDRYVLRALDDAALTPTDEADRSTWLRRVSLDLTGLPPTPDERAAFLADDGDDAYPRVVNRLLDSPRFGEHLARPWLDAARYGDTHGLHLDNYREMWPYRDWVVNAFNRNLPYDQFLVEQLAGDLLEDPTLDQLIATGFNRCHVTTAEGGSIKEEVYVRNVVDRVSTFGTVMLGLSVGCANCHDHKFDPISQREFFGLFAFFNNLDAEPLDGNAKVHAPVVRVPTKAQSDAIAAFDQQIEAVDAGIAAALQSATYSEPDDLTLSEAPRTTHVWFDDALPEGAQLEGDGFQWVTAADGPVYSGNRSMRRESRGNQQHFFRNAPTKLRIGVGDTLFAWVYLDPDQPPREVMLQFNSNGDNGWSHRAYWGENLIGYGKDGTPERLSHGPLPATGTWVKLEVDAAAVGLRPGMVVHGIAFTQQDGVAYWDAPGIESRLVQDAVDWVWIEDDVPDAAERHGDAPTWQWVEASDDTPVYAGSRSLRRSQGPRLNQDVFTKAREVTLQRDDRLFAYAWLDPNDPPTGIQLQFNDGTWEHRVRWGAGAHGEGRAGGADFVAGELPALGTWVRLEVDLESVDLAPGNRLNGWAFTQVGGTVFWDHAGVRTWGPPDERSARSLDLWIARARGDNTLPSEVRTALDQPDAASNDIVRDHYVRFVWEGARETFDPLEAERKSLVRQRKEVSEAVPTTLVMKERQDVRTAYLLHRGHYESRGGEVGRRTPDALPPMAESLPRDRLGLAQWLVQPDHPLTARVAVNRLWQHLFGTGLVATSDDFGNQGARPSHPALLDHLALEFVESGWNVKAFLRRVVLSATYRQASRTTPDRLRADPDNRWLSRGPRHRLDGEVLRDQALMLSGLLVEQLGGPGVKPPQPGGLWQAVGYVGSNTQRFQADMGPDKVHRRSLYTFWKRTAPPPQMSTLDAPSREACCVRRERTNTPLQALLLLNDPQYVECARALAARILVEGGASDGSRAAFGLELVTGKDVDGRDVADLLSVVEAQRAEFQSDPSGAGRLLGVGDAPNPDSLDPIELATWTVGANLLLNLDTVLTKE